MLVAVASVTNTPVTLLMSRIMGLHPLIVFICGLEVQEGGATCHMTGVRWSGDQQ